MEKKIAEKKIKKAILQYIKARKRVIALGNIYSAINGNDSIVGRIGEYYAIKFLESINQQPEKILNSSNKGFDLQDGEILTQVKVITHENKKGRSMRLKEPWNQFLLIELNEDYLPKTIGLINKQQLELAVKEKGWSQNPIVKRSMLGNKGLFGKYGQRVNNFNIEMEDKNLNCLLHFIANNLLKALTKRIINNTETVYSIFDTEECKLLLEVQDELKRTEECNDCQKCIDYSSRDQYLFEYISTIVNLGEEHLELLKKIIHEYNVKIDDKIGLIGFIIDIENSKGYISKLLDSDEKKDLSVLLKKVERAKTKFVDLSYNYLHADCVDRALAAFNLLEQKESDIKDFDEKKKINVYFDQNVFSDIQEDKIKRNKIIGSKNKYHYFYSPYHIEDAIKMSPLFLSSYYHKLDEISEDKIILITNDIPEFKKEKIDYSIKRVRLFREATKAAEEKRIYKMKLNHINYPKFDPGSHIVKKINEDIKQFFSDLNADRDEHKEIIQELNKILFQECHGLDGEDIISCKLKIERNKIIDTIQKLSDFLDAINYKTEKLKESQKIKSSFHDIEHLKNAWICDYFVTSDKKLLDRARYIYSILGIKTKVLSFEEYIQII